MLLTVPSSASVAARASSRRASKPAARPFTSSLVAPLPQRSVKVGFFNFGKKDDPNSYQKSAQRDEYLYEDVDDYFNYMGLLAEEGNYDRMEAMLKVLAPVDAILLLAASQNDTPKIIELLDGGANITVKDLNGKTPIELATKAETLEVLKKALNKVAA